jgi:hypothetical protein
LAADGAVLEGWLRFMPAVAVAIGAAFFAVLTVFSESSWIRDFL